MLVSALLQYSSLHVRTTLCYISLQVNCQLLLIWLGLIMIRAFIASLWLRIQLPASWLTLCTRLLSQVTRYINHNVEYYSLNATTDFVSAIECIQLTEPGKTTVICITRVTLVGQPLCVFPDLIAVSCKMK